MFCKINSSAVQGVDGTIITVEADVSDGLPMFAMVGYLSSSVKEAGERVRTSLKNSGFLMPPKRITINLSPADVRKDGTGFDLPIAIAILLCMGKNSKLDISNTVIVGELGLDGCVQKIPGILPMVYHAAKEGYEACIVPYENKKEAELVDGIKIVPVKNLLEAIDYICTGNIDIPHDEKTEDNNNLTSVDFSEIKGQNVLKRGMEIAAASMFNVLLSGAQGSGKSMIARRLPTILPQMTFDESVEVTKIYSVSGKLDNSCSLIRQRPFRAPHHTISVKGLCGGGSIPKPGEVSLAHNGVLFLDEIAEFNKTVLEVMRQPMEDGQILISRVNGSYIFPANFMMVAAQNPCPCGNYPNMKKCTCTPNEIRKYQNKISGPLLDRIDINMQVEPVSYEDIFSIPEGEKSELIRYRVEDAVEIQKKRFEDEIINYNSQLSGKLIKKYIKLGDKQEEILKKSFADMELSARGTYRILKIARTIADLSHNDEISSDNIKEAIFYRNNMGSVKL